MKYLLYVFIFLVLAAAAAFFSVRVFDLDQSTNTTPIVWETKNDDQQNVTVAVTPFDLSPQSAEWKFDIALNTHSVELDQDLTKISVLVDDQGKEHLPIRWEGPVPGGHHMEGVLVFAPIKPFPSYIEIKIRDIGSIAERSFKWNTQ